MRKIKQITEGVPRALPIDSKGKRRRALDVREDCGFAKVLRAVGHGGSQTASKSKRVNDLRTLAHTVREILSMGPNLATVSL